MRRVADILPALGYAILVVACLGQASGSGKTPDRLTNAEASEEQLIDRFLSALRRTDPDALRSLRVTEAEYREILMPGGVPEGRPLKRQSTTLADLAWGLVDTKSRYYEQSLLAEFGGRTLRRKAISYEDGEQRFANHTVRKQLRLKLEDADAGREIVLGTGSIVEVGGRYKFASFVRD
jgi:glycogen debranching enzyme